MQIPGNECIGPNAAPENLQDLPGFYNYGIMGDFRTDNFAIVIVVCDSLKQDLSADAANAAQARPVGTSLNLQEELAAFMVWLFFFWQVRIS